MDRKSSDLPILSVVIPVHNGGDAFRQCLVDLKQYLPDCAEVIVVADGESDRSWRLAQDLSFEVILLPQSGGPARARNVGAKAARGKILFFIDADVLVHANTLSQVLAAFQNNPRLSALIGSYDDAPGAPNFLSQYKNLFHHYVHQSGCQEASTFWGACGAIRREAFWAVGGFDERYRRPCIEDIELGYRLRQAGYSLQLCADIQVKHLKRWTPLSLLRAEIFYRALPWTALLLRVRDASPKDYRRFTSDLNLRFSSQLSVVLVFALLLLLLASGWLAAARVAAAGLSALLLVINLPVYQFFYQKRGPFFALRVIPWHWLYYFYSGASFAIGWLRHQVGKVQFGPAASQAAK